MRELYLCKYREYLNLALMHFYRGDAGRWRLYQDLANDNYHKAQAEPLSDEAA
jgi:hypothetical protein